MINNYFVINCLYVIFQFTASPSINEDMRKN